MSIKDLIIDQLSHTYDGTPGFDVKTADFHTLNSWQVSRLTYWATEYKYRKPKNANGSTARCFFYMLQRYANKKG